MSLLALALASVAALAVLASRMFCLALRLTAQRLDDLGGARKRSDTCSIAVLNDNNHV